MLKEIKTGVLVAISFIITLIIAWASYAAYITLTDVNSWETLTDVLFNKVLENQRVLRTDIDNITSSTIDIPVWSIISWHKSLTWVPSLPNGWVECDGSVISDVASSLNWETTPDLNSQVYSWGKWRYLRWGNTSWSFNASTAWDDNGSAYSTSVTTTYYWAVFWAYRDLENISYRVNYLNWSALDPNNFRFQVAAMTVVYIMKIK